MTQMRIRTLRNAFIACGAYYASTWVASLLSWFLTSAAASVQTSDYALRSEIRSIVNGAPDAVGAAFCGVAIGLLADSPAPARWTALPAVLMILASLQRAQIFADTWGSFATQALIGSLPAAVCIAAGQIATRHRL